MSLPALQLLFVKATSLLSRKGKEELLQHPPTTEQEQVPARAITRHGMATVRGSSACPSAVRERGGPDDRQIVSPGFLHRFQQRLIPATTLRHHSGKGAGHAGGFDGPRDGLPHCATTADANPGTPRKGRRPLSSKHTPDERSPLNTEVFLHPPAVAARCSPTASHRTQQADRPSVRGTNVAAAPLAKSEAGGSSSAPTSRNSFAENFLLGPQIGKGAYAPVHVATHRKTGNPVAVKIYDGFRSMSKDRKAVIVREIRVMRRLSHESIVKYAGIYNESKALYVLMQFLNGGSMHSLVKNHADGKLSEDAARALFKQICNAVQHMHSRSIVHRDLKLENILLDSKGRVKVIDFGFASIVKENARCRMRCGTPSYMPPEILLKKEYDGFSADIWSLGVVLYAMLHGGYPFRGHGLKELYDKILQGDFPLSVHLSDAAQQLICGMLSLQPVDRLTIDEILCHPWLTGET